jgi:uncharacterized membrane protein YqaE (UPF0057 family)
MSRSIIINILLFQLGWFACVLGGAYGHPLLGSLVAVAIILFHCYRATDKNSEIRLLVLALIIGFVFESIVSWQGLARYDHGQYFDMIAPHWMILMWPLFATTLNLSMSWLKNLAPLLVGLFGAAFAPLAYYAGFKLGAVEYHDLVLSLSIISITWAVLLPALVMFSQKFDGYRTMAAKDDKDEVNQYV